MIDKLNSAAVRAVVFLLAFSGAVSLWAGPVEDFDVALKHYQNKKFDLSTSAFADFIMKYPAHERRPLADLYYGQSLMQLRRFQDARVVFGEFQKANPDHSDFALAMYREAECTFFVGDVQAASRLFAAFVERFPENDLSAWGWYYLGESQLKLGNPERAAEAFQSGLTKFPKGQRVTETQFGLARANAALKQFDKAAAAFQAIADDPENPRAPDALFALGSMEFDGGRYQQAAAAFSAVQQKFPKYRQAAEAALNAGSSYYKLGEFDSAVEAFNAAAQSPKDKLIARFWAGQARRAQDRLEDAIEINKSAFNDFVNDPNVSKDDPTGPKLLYYWANCEFLLGRLEVAGPLFVQLAENYPSHEFADDSLQYAVEASLKSGDLQKAEEYHQKFVRDFPRSPLTMLETILHGRILLAQADKLGTSPPVSPKAKAKLDAAVEVFDGVARTSQVPRTSAWASLLSARAKSKLGNWQGVLETATPLNERLDALQPPAEFAESLYLTGIAATELQQWTLADASFERYLKLATDPKSKSAALSQLVLARTRAGKLNELEDLWPRFAEAGIPAGEMASAILTAAESAMKQQQFAEAAKLFERLEKTAESPRMRAAAQSGLGHALFNQRDFPAAAEAFGRLTDNPPAEEAVLIADAAFMKGHSLAEAKRTDEAADAYFSGALLIGGQKERLADPPADPQAAVYAYRCMRGAASQFEARNNIQRADDAYSQAWEYLQKLPEDQKADLDKLLNSWARANYAARNYKRSDELYARLLRNHPMSSFADDAKFFLAESKVQLGESKEAEADLKSLLESPTIDDAIRPEVLHNLVELTADRDGWEDTKKYAEELSTRYPSFKHALNARYRLGEAALRLSDIPAAREIFSALRQSILAGDTKPTDDLIDGVWILSTETEIAAPPVNYAEIDRLAEEFHQRFPESKLAYQLDYVHGRSLIKRAPPEVDKARAVFEKVIESPDGKNTETAAQAHMQLASTYLLSQKPEEYQKAYETYAYIVERYNLPLIQASALFRAGDLQEKLNKRDGAAETYREVITRFPSSEEAEKAKERLKALGVVAAPKPEPAPETPDEPTPAVNPALPSLP